MLLYEVTLDVDEVVAAEFRTWLDAHVQEMLHLDGFERAEVFEGEHTVTHRTFVAHYRVRTQAQLERYFAEDAERMRADGTARFGAHLRASRRVLRLHRDFGV